MFASVFGTNKASEKVRCDRDNANSYGKGSGGSGGNGSGTSVLRCWRSNEAGEREEVAPWERHRGDGREGPREALNNAERGSQSQSQKQVAGGSDDANICDTDGGRAHGGDCGHATAAGAKDGVDSYPVPDKRRIRIRGEYEACGALCSALTSSPYNTRGGGGCGGGSKGIGGGSDTTSRRRVSSPDSSRCSRRNNLGGGEEGEGEEKEAGAHSYTPSWVKRSGSSAQQNSPSRGVVHTNHHRRQRASREDRSPNSSEAARDRGRLSHSSLTGEGQLWDDRDGSEEQEHGGRWERSDPGDIESHRSILAGLKGSNPTENNKDGAWGGVAKGKPKGQDAALHRAVVPDPDILSSLKRGGSRNAK